MKKVIKISVIVLLVVAAIATTCFLFFRNVEEEQSKEISLLSFSASEAKAKLHEDLAETMEIINSDGTDPRFASLKTTLANLDSSYRVLTTYYIDSNFIVDNDNIAKSINSLNGIVRTSLSIMEEYKIKAEHTAPDGNKYFDRHLGANSLFTTLASFSVEYANLIKLVNGGIQGINKDADVKFAVINIYADVTIDTYSNVDTSESKWSVKSEDNISWLNTKFKLSHLYLETEAYTAAQSRFVKLYSECDSTLFASKLKENIDAVTEIKEDMSKEHRATFYFKEVMG